MPKRVRILRDRMGLLVGGGGLLGIAALYPLVHWLAGDVPWFVIAIPLGVGALGGAARLAEALFRGGFLSLDAERGVIVNHDEEIPFADITEVTVVETEHRMVNTELRSDTSIGYALKLGENRMFLHGAGFSRKRLTRLAQTLEGTLAEWRQGRGV